VNQETSILPQYIGERSEGFDIQAIEVYPEEGVELCGELESQFLMRSCAKWRRNKLKEPGEIGSCESISKTCQWSVVCRLDTKV